MLIESTDHLKVKLLLLLVNMLCSRVVQQVKTNPACLLREQQLEAQITLEAEEETLEMIDKSGDEGEWEGEESAEGEGEGDGEFGDEETGPLSNKIA